MTTQPNKTGIIHSIIPRIDCCLGSAVADVTIFCCTHIVTPTKIGNKRSLSGIAKFNQRKSLSKGRIECTTGQE